MRFDCSTIKFIEASDYNFMHSVYHKQINENEHVSMADIMQAYAFPLS